MLAWLVKARDVLTEIRYNTFDLKGYHLSEAYDIHFGEWGDRFAYLFVLYNEKEGKHLNLAVKLTHNCSMNEIASVQEKNWNEKKKLRILELLGKDLDCFVVHSNEKSKGDFMYGACSISFSRVGEHIDKQYCFIAFTDNIGRVYDDSTNEWTCDETNNARANCEFEVFIANDEDAAELVSDSYSYVTMADLKEK